MKVSLEIDDRAIRVALKKISEQVSPQGMRPVMDVIGEELTESVRRRFETSTAPDGSRWEGLSGTTILARLKKIQGAVSNEDGRLTKKGAVRVMGMKPLVETGILQDTIRYQVTNGGAGVAIGTNRFAGEWNGGAAVHQFGSSSGSKNKIPARLFLGFSKDDKAAVLDILRKFIADL